MRRKWSELHPSDNNVDFCRSGVGAPVVHECEGEYRHDSRKNLLEWNLTVIDSSNKTGVVNWWKEAENILYKYFDSK